MVYLDVNQEKNILDEIIISKFDNLPKLLEIIRSNPHITQNRLRIKSKFSGGKIYIGIKALKLLKFVTNGEGLIITEIGNQFLNEYLKDEKLPRDILKQACLNIPLYSKIYNNNKEITNQEELFKLFEIELREKYPELSLKLIGSTVRRYIRGIHNINIRAGARMGYNRKSKDNQLTKNNILNHNKTIKVFKELKVNLNLSKDELYNLINNLPEEKKREVFSQLFSEVF